jgi:hypothetical protein
MTTGNKIVAGKKIYVNDTQLQRQQPNIRRFVETIE